MRNLNFFAAIIVAALVLAGCSGTPTTDKSTEKSPAENTPIASKSEPSSTIIEPGDLLSSTEATQVIGEEMTKQKACTDNAVVGQKICFYEGKDDRKISPYLQISLVQDNFFINKTPGAAKELYLNTKKMMDNPQPVQLGEDAYYSGAGFSSLNVLYKGYSITIMAGYVPKGKDNKAVSLTAAQTAVNNLEKKLGK